VLSLVGVCAGGAAASASVVGATAAVTGRVSWIFVEGDPEVDLDLPARDAHVVHDKAEELLALLEAEFVDANGGSASEVADSLLQSVVDGELLALRDQLVALLGKRVVAVVDVACPTLDFVQLE
jgi:hypothetical protein